MDEKLVKCFHVSHMSNRASILEKGLLATDSRSNWYKNRLCFSVNERYLGFDYVGFHCIDVWSFYMPEEKLRIDEFADASCHMYVQENIPTSQLTLEFTKY
jgi:hypothetical protein